MIEIGPLRPGDRAAWASRPARRRLVGIAHYLSTAFSVTARPATCRTCSPTRRRAAAAQPGPDEEVDRGTARGARPVLYDKLARFTGFIRYAYRL